MGHSERRRRDEVAKKEGSTAIKVEDNPYLQHRASSSTSSPSTNPWTNRPYSKRYHEILEVRKTLPVNDSRDLLLRTVKESQVVVLEGETGSGKTTQVPQFLVNGGYVDNGKMVCCTQPRRVAAISVAKRVAQEMDVEVGKQVGYSVRFEEKTSPGETVLKFLTDGMLLREAMSDHELSDYSAIILDEAHERTVSTDVLMGLIKTIMQKRPDIRVIVMSATIDTEKFRDYFNGAPLLSVPGRMFPVETFYSPSPVDNYVDAAIETVIEICEKEPPGDILVFLTGEEEIEEACRSIASRTSRKERQWGPITVYPLYGALPPDRQQRVFDDAPPPLFRGGPPGRKVICSTNIAETSLTIDGIVYVVDPGFAKQKVYNPRARVESLIVDSISQASAKQRTGRAGRTRPGKCFRLYTKESFSKDLAKTSYPEILRSNLGNVVLHLKKLGIDDLVHFDFMDAPAPETMMRALELLNYLGAIDDEGDLTGFGDMMSSFPLDPESAVALIKSVDYNVASEVLTIVSMLSTAQNCFLFPKSGPMKRNRRGDRIGNDSPKKPFQNAQSDHIMFMNVYNSFIENGGTGNDGNLWCRENSLNYRALRNADNVRSQLERIMRKRGLSVESKYMNDKLLSENVRKTFLCGFFMQVAYQTGKRMNYMIVKDEERVRLHPSSGLKGESRWLMYHEYVMTQRNFIRTCSEVDPKWLVTIAPHYFDLSNFPDGPAKDVLQRVYSSVRRESREKRAEDVMELS